MKAYLSTVLALLVLVAVAHGGNTVTNSGDGHTTTMTVTYNADTGLLTWNHSWTRAGTISGGPGAWVYTTTGDGGGYGIAIHDHAGHPTETNSHSGTYALASGSWVRIGARIVNSVGAVSDVHGWYQVTGAPPTYGVTLTIPANTTQEAILYIITQGTDTKGSYVQQPGAAETTVYIGNLSSLTPPVVLNQVTGGDVTVGKNPDGSPNYDGPVSANSGTNLTPVSTGTPSVETSPGSGATAIGSTPSGGTGTAPGTPPSNPLAPPVAPTPTTPTSAPTPTPPVSGPGLPTNPTPTGTDAARKEDIMAAANQISDRIVSASVKAVETGNATIQAVDKVAAAVVSSGNAGILATDKVAAAVKESTTKLVEAANRGQAVWVSTRDSIQSGNAKLDSINSALGTVNSHLVSANEKLDSIKTNTAGTATAIGNLKSAIEDRAPTVADAQTAATAATNSGTSQGGTAKTAAQASVDQATPTFGAGEPAPSAGTWEIPLAGDSLNVDPANVPEVATAATWIKGFLSFIILGTYTWWMWAEFRGLMSTAVLVQQAKGNTVAAGTGGQATALIAAAAISTALLALPAAFFALSSLGVSGLNNNPFTGQSGAVGRGMYLLYFFVPVSALLSAIAGAFVVRKGGIVLLLGAAALVRFVVP